MHVLRHLPIAGLIALAFAVSYPLASPAAAGSVFTVAKYPVGAADKNAVAAKEKALADGQRAAFRSLMKRIVPVTAYQNIARLGDVKAANYVSGVSIRSERNSSTEYIANLDFSFQPDAVRQLLQSQGVPFVDAQAESVTVVPVIRRGSPGDFKGDSGAWRSAWNGLDLENTVTPVKLADLKPEVHADTIAMLTNGNDRNANDQGLRILAGEYHTDRVVLAIFEQDETGKSVTVTLAGQDAVGPLLVRRGYNVTDGDTGYASELAAIVALGVLEGRWKVLKYDFSGAAATAVQYPGQNYGGQNYGGQPYPNQAYGNQAYNGQQYGNQSYANQGYGSQPQGAAAGQPVWSAGAASSYGEAVNLVAEFNSDRQWDDIRGKLLDTPGVDNVAITSMTTRNASIALNYPGGINALANALGGRGLALFNNGAAWVLRPTY